MTEHLLPQFDLRQIAQSGQCFRLTEQPDGSFLLLAQGRALRMRQQGSRVRFSCTENVFRQVWAPYFDLQTDYSRFLAAVPARDRYLSAAAQFGNGIRILRQDPWEMLVTFIISQRNTIPAIRGSVEALCARCGRRLPGSEERYSFPTPQALSRLSESELRACALGYRAPYIQKTAALVAGGHAPLEAFASLSDEALVEQLCRLPGVGIKVANCVALFGYHRIGAFPRDVWINRVLEQHYSDNFPLGRYKGFAGVIQQYLFYYARCSEVSDAVQVDLHAK